MRDVVNLAWKLAAVLRGDVRGAAASALLDSHGQERRTHVIELTTRLKAIGAVICEHDADAARHRDQMLAEGDGTVQPRPRQDLLPRLTATADTAIWRGEGDGCIAEAEGVMACWFVAHGCQAALLRPDHYVYGTAVDAPRLRALLDGAVAAQQGPAGPPGN